MVSINLKNRVLVISSNWKTGGGIISRNHTMNHVLGLGNKDEIFASSHKSSTENQGLIDVMIYHKVWFKTNVHFVNIFWLSYCKF